MVARRKDPSTERCSDATPSTGRRSEVTPSTGPTPRDPTPEEIRLRCAEIQAGWTEEERAARRSHAPPWYFRVYEDPGSLEDVRRALAGSDETEGWWEDFDD